MSLRLKYGLLWNKAHLSWKECRQFILGLAFGISLALGTAGIASTIKAQEEIARAESISQQFMDFLNGGTIISEDEHFAARCVNLLEVTN